MWRFDDAPDRVFGGDPADSAAWLGAADIVSWLPAARVAVTIPGLNTVRVYDLLGRALFEFGSAGRASGRFTPIGSLWVTPGGNLAVAARRDGSIELFDSAGSFAGRLVLEDVPSLLRTVPIGGFSDGSIAAWSPASQQVLPDPGTRLRDTLIVARFDSAGRFTRELARVAGFRYVVFDDGGGARQIAAPFAGPAAAVVHDSLLIVAETDRPGLLEISTAGDTIRAIRWAAPVPVTEVMRQEFAAFLLASAEPSQGALVGRFLDVAGFPDRLPAVRSILVDDRGNRWVEPWRLPWDSAADWTVIDSAGRWLGRVPVPRSFRPAAFRADQVLGLFTDPDGTPRPAIHTLRRQSPPPS
jgi:hypothetical protein